MCRRVLGDLDALRLGGAERVRAHYDAALGIARGISKRNVLIEALLARGRWLARQQQDAPAAFSDLREALGYAEQGGCRIYEADNRIALAWAFLAPAQAVPEAERALQMSATMGYYWGKLDAQDALAAVSHSTGGVS
jgi:hypothetical protein